MSRMPWRGDWGPLPAAVLPCLRPRPLLRPGGPFRCHLGHNETVDVVPPSNPVAEPGGEPPLTGQLNPETPPAASPGAGRRTGVWVGLFGLLLAVTLLGMLSGRDADPDAPPPVADSGPLAADGESSGGLVVGADAPLDFTLKDVNGVDVNLASFKGKVILINFWATWCGPCRVEIPDLIELQGAYRDDLVVLGIDVLDEFSRVEAFAREMKVNYPMLDANNREDVEKAYGPMWGLPTSVVVDRDGKVHRKHSGIATKEQLEQYVQSAL